MCEARDSGVATTFCRRFRGRFELKRPHRIVFTWILDESEEADPGKVVLTVEPVGEGCVANIVHELDAKWAEYIPQTENGWSRMLQASAELPG